jgi:phosphatidylethanolamine-binding protein (PEBP) family uncharacterized protein
VTRLSTIAFVAVISLSACSVELAGQGEVTVDDASSRPADDVPPGATPGTQGHTPGTSAPVTGAPGAPGAGDAGRSVLDASAPVSPPQADAALAEDAAVPPGQPGTPGQPGMPGTPGQPGMPETPDASAGDAQIKPIDPPPTFVLTSPAFMAGAKIPSLHTCNGADVSPVFAWQGVPAGTKSFVMVLTTHTDWVVRMVDWQRWVMWNIPATRTGLPASIEEGHTPSDVPGAIQASNESETQTDWATGSGGPGGSFSGPGGGSAGGGGAPGGGSSGSDDKVGRRYRGPCSYGRPQTFEFTLFALGEGPPAPAWKLGITTDEIVAWLKTDANVLGMAVLNGISP